MEQLIREGKISYVGSSNFAGWDIATAQCKADARNLLGLASEQSLYNLTQRTVELEVIPALRHYGIGLIPWSPVGMGMLGGVLKKLPVAAGQHRSCRHKSTACGRNWRPGKHCVMSWGNTIRRRAGMAAAEPCG